MRITTYLTSGVCCLVSVGLCARNRPNKAQTNRNIWSQLGLLFIHTCFFVYFRLRNVSVFPIQILIRGIEWPLRAFASMRAVRLFLRARPVINFLMRAASTLEITKGEQWARRKFSASWNLSLLRRCFAPSNLADTFKTGQQAQG